jgi:hypothetical protein
LRWGLQVSYKRATGCLQSRVVMKKIRNEEGMEYSSEKYVLRILLKGMSMQ